jgi:ubiquitin-conjugating enzyme E2 R
MSGEKAEERWNPTQSVESILLSVISLINDPNCSSPANVDAGVLYRNDREAFDAIARRQVEASKKNIPEGLDLKGISLFSKYPRCVYCQAPYKDRGR